MLMHQAMYFPKLYLIPFSLSHLSASVWVLSHKLSGLYILVHILQITDLANKS